MDQLTITEVSSPYTADFKEVLFYCRIIFGLSEDEIDQLMKQMKNYRRISPDRIHVLIARKGAIFVGFTVVYYLSSSKSAYMEYIGVLPQFRRQGVGSILYRYVLNILPYDNSEVRGMLYEVNQDKEGLIGRIKFFAKLGASELDVSNIELLQKYKIVMFYHNLNKRWLFSSSQVPQIMLDLTYILM